MAPAGRRAASAAVAAMRSRMASVCAACQRLNGSASVRSRKRRSSGVQVERRASPAPRSRGGATAPAAPRRREDDRLARLGEMDHVAVDAPRLMPT